MKPLIIANWKCNPDSPRRAVLLAQKIERAIGRARNVEVVIAPPYPFLVQVRRVLKKVKLGAQNVFWEDLGPYTGEVSWRQLKHLGAQYVLIGHSERRRYLEETDGMINKKVLAALDHGLIPVLCVGEEERSGNEIPAIVGEQLKRALKGVRPSRMKSMVVAYEPVWAVSTMPGARADTPDNAFGALVYIRKIIAGLYGNKAAGLVRVVYGGSVTEKNITAFLRDGRMEGALAGGASLRPDEFINIVRIAAQKR